MPRRETLNNANRAKIMADSFGHYNNFATLSPAFRIFNALIASSLRKNDYFCNRKNKNRLQLW